MISFLGPVVLSTKAHPNQCSYGEHRKVLREGGQQDCSLNNHLATSTLFGIRYQPSGAPEMLQNTTLFLVYTDWKKLRYQPQMVFF